MISKNRLAIAGVALAALMILAVTGCAKTPDWVKRGNGAFDLEGQKVFYGVGVVTGIKNPALQRSTADDRARAEVAKVLNTYVKYLAKDYMASTTGQTSDGKTVSSEEQHVEQALQTAAKAQLHGAMIIDHWTDPKEGTYFSLCKMDLNFVKKMMNEEQTLDKKLKEHIQKNADRLHQQIGPIE